MRLPPQHGGSMIGMGIPRLPPTVVVANPASSSDSVGGGDLSPSRVARMTNTTNTTSTGPSTGRKTHIEVCVRLRPLRVENESSNSFFDKQSRTITSGVSGIPGPGMSRLRKPQIPSRLGFSKSPPRQDASPKRLEASSNDSAITGNGGKVPIPVYAWDVISKDTIGQSPLTDIVPGRTHQYTLDGVYGPSSRTIDVYNQSVRDLVRAALDGYHTSVLAYGQTSTGKTHTMTGTSLQPGIVPLSIRDCFHFIQNQPQGQNREYLLRLSYLEVYKEHIRDLLQPSDTAPPVRLFETSGKDGGLIIRNVQEEVVSSPEQVFALLRQGESRRQIGATTMNQHSSRSHVLVRVWMESRPRGSNNGSNTPTTICSSSSSISSETSNGFHSKHPGTSGGSGVRVSSLTLCDLAGSESVKLTGSNDRQKEGHYINQSLMTLGKVVYALSEQEKGDSTSKRNHQHIPYRDSKLTRLLQPSLSGNAQVVLLCCISPLALHIEESHNTLKFALRAKNIPQRATITETKDEKTLLLSYREEIDELKRQLKEAKEQQELLLKYRGNGSPRHDDFSVTADMVDEDEIDQLVKSIQTMEKLILKNNMSSSDQPEDLLDTSDYDPNSRDEEDDLMALADKDFRLSSSTQQTPGRNMTASTPMKPSFATPMQTPFQKHSSTNRDLETELSRVKGLLGSVMKKRRAGEGGGIRNGINGQHSTSEDEVKALRAQLEKQQVASSLRKADSSFLQKQLEEKDQLLQEVSKILEALEARHVYMEQENAKLREEVARMKNETR